MVILFVAGFFLIDRRREFKFLTYWFSISISTITENSAKYVDDVILSFLLWTMAHNRNSRDPIDSDIRITHESFQRWESNLNTSSFIGIFWEKTSWIRQSSIKRGEILILQNFITNRKNETIYKRKNFLFFRSNLLKRLFLEV